MQPARHWCPLLIAQAVAAWGLGGALFWAAWVLLP